MLTFALACALIVPWANVQDGRVEAPATLLLEPGAALTPETFESYRAAVAPTVEEEAWRALPWRATFWQGVIDAQAAERPVLLFAMNGHPFGCT